MGRWDQCFHGVKPEAVCSPSPTLIFVLSLPDHEAILITLLLIFLLFLPALMIIIYFWYRRENSLLNKWIKEIRRRSRETYRWVMPPKSLLSQGPSKTQKPCFLATVGIQSGRNGFGELVLHRVCFKVIWDLV